MRVTDIEVGICKKLKEHVAAGDEDAWHQES